MPCPLRPEYELGEFDHGHCHCWDDSIAGCCWCGYDGDDDPDCPAREALTDA